MDNFYAEFSVDLSQKLIVCIQMKITYFQNFKAKILFWDLGFSKPYLNDVREVTGSGKNKNRIEKPKKINFLPISLLRIHNGRKFSLIFFITGNQSTEGTCFCLKIRGIRRKIG